MRLDHIAYRVQDRKKAAQFLIDAFGYRVQTEFDIEFDDRSTTECIALQPPERSKEMDRFNYNDLWTQCSPPAVMMTKDGFIDKMPRVSYHLAPELFVSNGSPDSIVGMWVAERGGVGGVHHLAYQVGDVETTMREWIEKGWAKFASERPLRCPGLTQVFTEPHPLTGVIYEFIKRDGDYGFCRDNVRELMLSAAGVK